MTSGPDRARIERLLEMEFENLQKINDKYDGSRFMVKNWAVTTAGAIVALSVTARSPGLAVIGVAAVGAFAYLEILYIYLQDHVVARCNRVEDLLDAAARGDVPTRADDYRFGISHAFKGKYELRGVVNALRGRPHIYALHIGLMTALMVDAAVLAFTT